MATSIPRPATSKRRSANCVRGLGRKAKPDYNRRREVKPGLPLRLWPASSSGGNGHRHMWWRRTVCFRKADGKWLATHEHRSVPFDVERGKASLDLKPS